MNRSSKNTLKNNLTNGSISCKDKLVHPLYNPMPAGKWACPAYRVHLPSLVLAGSTFSLSITDLCLPKPFSGVLAKVRLVKDQS